MSFTVQEVAQLLKKAKENKKPYVFFTGAGCSVSADVPSSTGLIEEIRTQFPIQVKNIDHEKDKYNYGKYMSALDKDERRRLLKPHIIDNKKINWAHIALACLMQAEYLERVLTFNFDSILSRACNMLGLHPSIYDFATANPHLYHLINDPSIVHLHGQGTGFVQLNTEDETGEAHTKKLGEFIAATLNSNPSLFIGYSGNADAFFPLLEEKYSEQHRLIWTGTRTTIDELESKSVKTFLKKNNNITHYIGDIYADNFLIQLAKELDCFPPELFSNPYNFLNQQLESIQPYPLGDGLDILANLSEYLKQQSVKPLVKSLYTAFIYTYPDKESTKGLSEKAINEVMWAYDQQARYLIKQRKPEDGFKIYDQALLILNRHFGCLYNYAWHLSDYANLTKNENLFQKAFDLYERAFQLQPINIDNLMSYAVTLHQLAAIKQNETLFEKTFEKIEIALKVDPNNIDILSNYGNALLDLAKIKQNETLFEKAFEQYEKALNIKHDHVNNLNNYGTALLDLAKINQDETLFEKALKQYEKALNFNPNFTYNIACWYALNQKFEKCKEYLIHAEINNTLLSNDYNLSHILDDEDLNNVRNEPWFIELLERLKAKEELTANVS